MMEDNLRNRKTSTNLNNNSAENDKDQQNAPPKTTQFDANIYATKKTVAESFLNVAMLTSNAKQLNNLLVLGPEKQMLYYPMVGMACASILLQGIMGFLHVIVGRVNINENANTKKASYLNDGIIYMSLIVSMMNIVLSQFVQDSGL